MQFQNLADVELLESGVSSRLRILFLADDRHKANVVTDHIQAFVSNSRHEVFIVNTIHEAFPKEISTSEYDVILLHYSIYILSSYFLPMGWARAIALFPGYKAQIIQDECRHVNAMKQKMAYLGVGAVFSSLNCENLQKVYGGELLSETIFYSCLPGYISRRSFEQFSTPIASRKTHIVYRGRELTAELGLHAQDKQNIGKLVKNANISDEYILDIEWAEDSRVYGQKWEEFLASGRCTLGVEGGASIFDFDGSFSRDVSSFKKSHPEADFDQIWNELLKDYEGNIVHKTITPKIFEAIAAKTALILYPGEYRGILQADKHYIALAPDGSNIDEVLSLINDSQYLQEMVDRVYKEIMERNDLSMEFYVQKVDLAIANNRAMKTGNLRNDYSSKSKILNVLVLYNATQTYTSTVYEHLLTLSEYSNYNYFYVHQNTESTLNISLNRFDAIILHYSIRLPFDQISEKNASILERYQGLKVLFIQDEYDNTNRAKYWIKRLRFQLVFTAVPENNITSIYPQNEFPDTKFVNNLTGYIPENISDDFSYPSARKLTIGYRGRNLPVQYGQLGFEKSEIGRLVREYCINNKINQDIEWTEEARIYGDAWYSFMSSCRAMLGTESGSNVLNRDGTLAIKVQEYRENNPQVKDNEIYKKLIQPYEKPGLMNQISPRIFETIATRTVLVLFEGYYSGVVLPNIHYIPLKKDGSNLDEVFLQLSDDALIDNMVERAYQDIIMTGKYSYKCFVEMIDVEILKSTNNLESSFLTRGNKDYSLDNQEEPTFISTIPCKAEAKQGDFVRQKGKAKIKYYIKLSAHNLWIMIPESVRRVLKPALKKLIIKS